MTQRSAVMKRQLAAREVMLSEVENSGDTLDPLWDKSNRQTFRDSVIVPYEADVVVFSGAIVLTRRSEFSHQLSRPSRVRRDLRDPLQNRSGINVKGLVFKLK